jgi:hypothetical protein
MSQGSSERRRGRRVPVKATLQLRRLGAAGGAASREHTTQNLSLAGAYFEADHPTDLAMNDLVLASVSIPETERRAFPFARLAGRSRIVRIQELPAGQAQDAKRFGVAIEFSPGATALTAIPTSG